MASAGEGALLHFQGACDGSAVVRLLDGRLLVASDRDNWLRIYELEGGAPVDRMNLYPHTAVGPNSKRNFSAFEGVARLGERIYWVTSHARNRIGQTRPNRRRLLALNELRRGEKSVLKPTGESYRNLATQLSMNPRLSDLGISRSIQAMYVELLYLAPTRLGLSIQGLAAMPGGRRLLMALRNPRPGNRALLIPIENPADVINGVADTRFGEPIRLDLGGFGVSSLEYSAARGSYLLLAGRHDQSSGFKLFEWAGGNTATPVLLADVEPPDLNAEALVVSDDGRRALILSDDGERASTVKGKKACRRRLLAENRCVCDSLVDGERKSFRGRWVDLPAPAPRGDAPLAPNSEGGER